MILLDEIFREVSIWDDKMPKKNVFHAEPQLLLLVTRFCYVCGRTVRIFSRFFLNEDRDHEQWTLTSTLWLIYISKNWLNMDF